MRGLFGRTSSRVAGATAFAALLALAALLPATAGAVNTRVSIANYAWSNPEVHVDLGEKVTWDWLGPDLAHSVTGISAERPAVGLRPAAPTPPSTGPATATRCSSTQPGTYFFQCKLHAVRARRRGRLRRARRTQLRSGPAAAAEHRREAADAGGSFSLPKRGHEGRDGVSAQRPGQRAGHARRRVLPASTRRAGASTTATRPGTTFIGINHLRLGARWKHFRARPGRYQAVLRATDESANESKPVTQALHDRRLDEPRLRRRLRERRRAGSPASREGPFAGFLGRLAHRDLEHRQQRVGGERAHPVERLAHLRPVLLGAAGLVERLPDLLDEEVDEGAGDAFGVAAQLLGGRRPPPRG